MSHTPGPWTSDWDDNGFFTIEPTRGYVMGCPGDQAEDDARLTAAAPELLKALRLALPILEEEQDCLERSYLPQPSPDEERALGSVRDAVRETRAAIAKATGGDL